MSRSSPSIHDREEIPEPPEGWVGGELVNTGGGLFARMWIHPEKELRVGYSVNEPLVVGVERVRHEGEETSNPLSWVHVDDVRNESCDGEGDCLETALAEMESA